MHRIFIVEDDAAIAAALQKHLTTWGFDVRCAEDFRNVLAECTAFDPQLVLLDITLPFYNGYHWCQELRRVSNVPVVFISSASDNMNIVMAMNMGGDDFIAKPFDLNVLLAKIQAILRRTYDFAAPAPTLEHRGAVLNTADASLMYQGQRIELTKNDYRILQTLLERKGTPTVLAITRGLGDALRIGYQHRPDIFDRHIVLPELLYTRTIEIEERLGADGTVIQPLDREKARADLRALYERPRRSAVGKGGKFVALDGDERATEEAELRKAIDANCR